MIRIGVLSTAKIGRKFVLPAMARSEHCTLIAVSSRDLQAARALADQYRAPYAFDSEAALLACPEVDAVYIPLPTHLHVAPTLAALAAGKHVLVEKPMALTADDIVRVRQAAQQANRQVMEAFMVAFHPQWQWVREVLASGRLGRIYKVTGHFTYFNRDAANFRNAADQGGGGLRDVGVYPLICARLALASEPRLLAAHVERDPAFGVDRYADFDLDFDGIRAHFYCGTQQDRSQGMCFHGEHGRIVMSAPFNPMDFAIGAEVCVYTKASAECERRSFAPADHYLHMLDHFAAVIRGEQMPRLTLQGSEANQRVIDAIFKRAAHH